MKTSQLRNIIREELLKELNEVENTEYGSMYSSPQQQQSEMNKLLKQVEELKQMRDDLDRQIDQLEKTQMMLRKDTKQQLTQTMQLKNHLISNVNTKN